MPRNAKEQVELQKAFEAIAVSPYGITVLKYVLELTCYQDSLLRLNAENEVNVQAGLFHMAQREIWLHIRKLIPHDSLVQIENPKEGK